jgi:hypothetical protein
MYIVFLIFRVPLQQTNGNRRFFISSVSHIYVYLYLYIYIYIYLYTYMYLYIHMNI